MSPLISIVGDFGLTGNISIVGNVEISGDVSISSGQLVLPGSTRADQIPQSPGNPGTIWNNGGILTVAV